MPHYVMIGLLLMLLAGCNTTRGPTRGVGITVDDVNFNEYMFDDEPAVAPLPAKCQPATTGAEVLRDARLEVDQPVPVIGVAFDPASGALLLRTAHDVRVWDVLQGQQRGRRPDDGEVAFASGLNWPGGGINLYLNAEKGTLDIFSGASGERKASIWLSADAWAVVDEQGRFDADARHWRQFHWRSGADRLNFMQLADMYFEPSLLGKLAAGARFDTADAPPVAAGIALPPRAQLAMQVHGDAARVSGEVTVTRRGGCIGTVRVFHNGKAMALQAPSPRNPDARQEVWRFSTPLEPGEHLFEALATSARKVQGEVSRAEVQMPGHVVRQPRAHVLAVGIDHYVNAAMRLNFAVADAEGIAAWAQRLATETGTGFEEVVVTRVYDKEATRPRILRELAALQEVGAQDTVLIYLAGHGENDGVRWFFLPAEFGREINFEAIAAEGISSKVLQRALIKIPARRIALVVDACKSGDLRSVFAAATDSRYLEWVSRTAGVKLMAATDQEQLAMELPELGHGALTYTLLQGLSGKADGEPDNGIITVGELFRYAERSLPEVTGRIAGEKQYPVVFEYGADFPLERRPGH